MSLKAKVEAIIYAAEEPVTLEQIALLLKEVVLADLAKARENAAIEQADSGVEELVADSEDTATESTLLPELAPESLELLCPEAGPLMPPTTDAPTNLEAASESASSESATVNPPEAISRKRQPKKTAQEIADDKAVRERIWDILVELVTDYAREDRGIEIRQVAGGFRMATKPEHHDVVRAFAKSLKPPIRLSLAALETLAVIAYKQPVTAPEIAEIRGVESASVLGTLLDRKLITTAGRKQVIGRPMQYKTSKDFLLRFGLNHVNELPSMEEFSQFAADGTIEIASPDRQETLFRSDRSTAPDSGTLDASGETGGREAPEPPSGEPTSDEEPEKQAQTGASQVPELQSPDADEADSQPQSDAEPGELPEAGHTAD